MPQDQNITNSQEQNASTNQQSQNQTQNQGDNTIKKPEEWTTGNEPMTGAQKSYLKTLSDQAGEEMNDNLTKAEASKRIDELQQKTGRGKSGEQGVTGGVPNQANTGEAE